MEMLIKFLDEARIAADIYKENIDEKINICLGNVSCDMDSSIGAIILGYYMSHKAEYFNDYGNYENFWIPIINCPRAEIDARIDIAFHLKNFGIDKSKLVFIDDLDLNFYSSRGLLKLAIIDHNKLDLSQEQWVNDVVFILDHHVDMNECPKAEKVIQFCGSACSMAMDLIFENKLEEKILTKDICQFFIAAILIDCENFHPSLKGTKWGDLDEQAIFKINRVIMKFYYNELLNKKIDRELNIKLGLELMLRKDYKNYQWLDCVAGISVVFNPIHEIMSTFGVEELRRILKKRMEDNGLNIYCVITQIYLKTGEAFRELMIYDEDVGRLGKVCDMFEKACTYPLQKKKFTGLSKNFSFYLIKDSSVSRKKIEPILKEIFESFK
jgi:inorganic pyrophosphatase/exopolyphosphatase